MIKRFKTLMLVIGLGSLFTIVIWQLLSNSAVGQVQAVTVGPELRFIDEIGNPIVWGRIRLLCFEMPNLPPSDDIAFITSASGHPTIDLPLTCNYVAALQQKHQQPSGKPEHGPAYWVYTTSWAPGEANPINVTPAGQHDITINSTQPLILFNVVTSLAWEPATDQYNNNLHAGLENGSAYLYDVTDGNMAFGPVTHYSNGRNWLGADIRVLPANDFRPSAQIGGIVPAATAYMSPLGESTVYTPGAIYLGRNWITSLPDPATVKVHGADDFPAVGNWQEEGAFRTIIHEWAHYALFLYDEYENERGEPAHCLDPLNRDKLNEKSNASILDWHYSATELWHDDDPPVQCDKTRQGVFHGISDCQTLTRWYEIQQLPGEADYPPLNCASGEAHFGPDAPGLTQHLFNRLPPAMPSFLAYMPLIIDDLLPLIARHQREQGAYSPTTIDAGITVEAGGLSQEEKLSTQVYVLQGGDIIQPKQLLYQGQIITDSSPTNWQGHITLLGVEEDLVHVFGEHQATEESMLAGGRWFGQGTTFDGANIRFLPISWPATMDAEYMMDGFSRLSQMNIKLIIPKDEGLVEPPQAQLCNPADIIRCHPDWQQPMELDPTSGDPQVWTTSFRALDGYGELPRFGYVRAVATYDFGPNEIENRELIRWYKASGVGPGVQNVHAPAPPSEDDFLTLYTAVEIPHCEQAVFMPAANHDALSSSLGFDPTTGKAIKGILGYPFDIAVGVPLGDGNCPQSFGLHSQDVTTHEIYLTLFYNHPLLSDNLPDPFEPIEDNLRVLYFDPSDPGLGWHIIPLVDMQQSKELNWLAVPFQRDGIYAIGWIDNP